MKKEKLSSSNGEGKINTLPAIVSRHEASQRSVHQMEKPLRVFQKDKAMDFVEHVLLLRDDTDFRSFHLSGFGSYLDSCRIMTWLIQASRRKEVDSSFCKSHQLPLFIFTSHIQEFKLKLRASGFYRSDSSVVRVRVPK